MARSTGARPRPPSPSQLGGLSRASGRLDIGIGRFVHRADQPVAIDRAVNLGRSLAGAQHSADDRPRQQHVGTAHVRRALCRRRLFADAVIASLRITSRQTVNLGWDENLGMASRLVPQRLDWVADHLLGGHPHVEQRIYEACVRPVFQEAAHKIGQQILVPTHGRVGAQRELFSCEGIKRLAHAVQPLVLNGYAGALRHQANRRQRVRVVRRELGG